MNSEILSLMKRLEKHPYLLTRLNALLEVAENKSGDYDLADDAEEKIFNEVRQLGNEMLQGWAQGQIECKSEEVSKEKKY